MGRGLGFPGSHIRPGLQQAEEIDTLPYIPPISQCPMVLRGLGLADLNEPLLLS